MHCHAVTKNRSKDSMFTKSSARARKTQWPHKERVYSTRCVADMEPQLVCSWYSAWHKFMKRMIYVALNLMKKVQGSFQFPRQRTEPCWTPDKSQQRHEGIANFKLKSRAWRQDNSQRKKTWSRNEQIKLINQWSSKALDKSMQNTLTWEIFSGQRFESTPLYERSSDTHRSVCMWSDP